MNASLNPTLPWLAVVLLVSIVGCAATDTQPTAEPVAETPKYELEEDGWVEQTPPPQASTPQPRQQPAPPQPIRRGSFIYVCDASGSMIGTRSILARRYIEQAVSKATPNRFFNVMFYNTGKPEMLSEQSMIPATPENQRRLADFMATVDFSAGTDPLPALQEALRQRPAVIWLLADGDFPDPNGVISALDRWNPARRTVINTVLFLNDDETAEETLREIAADHGGEFTKLTRDQLR